VRREKEGGGGNESLGGGLGLDLVLDLGGG